MLVHQSIASRGKGNTPKWTFTVPKPNTDFLRKSTSYKAISLWNSEDNRTRDIPVFQEYQEDVEFYVKCSVRFWRNLLVNRDCFKCKDRVGIFIVGF